MPNVFLYIPNLIGYARIIFCIVACCFAFHDPMKTAIFYLLSQGLDALDGVAARHFNQSTRFGAMLDQLTDRMSTLSLLVVLSHFYPDWWGVFTLLIVLDITAHWMQMYSKTVQGLTTHKTGNNFFIKFYYAFPNLLICCVGNEVFFVSLYVRHFFSGPMLLWDVPLVTLVGYICFPVFLFKNFMNIVQLVDSAKEIASLPDPTANKMS